MDTLETRQRVAQAWFEALQHRLIAAMEALEDACPLHASGAAPGRFVIEPWSRVDRSGSSPRSSSAPAARSLARNRSAPLPGQPRVVSGLAIATVMLNLIQHPRLDSESSSE